MSRKRFVSAILTAAGVSSRMGRFKPLLPWRGVPLITYQIESLSAAGVNEIVVVLGHEHERAGDYVKGPIVRGVINPDYRLGRTTSVVAGVAAAQPYATDMLLLGVDQPRPSGIIERALREHIASDALITSPRRRGRGGHPLIFSAALRGELESITDEGLGAREVFDVHRGEVNEVEIDDPIIRLDLNTPEEYESAIARFGR